MEILPNILEELNMHCWNKIRIKNRVWTVNFLNFDNWIFSIKTRIYVCAPLRVKLFLSKLKNNAENKDFLAVSLNSIM
jgi:hypothetical protein